jgi:hypothetical protein
MSDTESEAAIIFDAYLDLQVQAASGNKMEAGPFETTGMKLGLSRPGSTDGPSF